MGTERQRKLLCIANCQGPALFGRFLSVGSPEFSKGFSLLPFIQVHLLAPDQGPMVARLIAEADVIALQPVVRHAVPEVLFDRVTAAARGKDIVSLPALHFDALFPTQGPRAWPGDPAYPFGAVEDAFIAAAFCAGLDPAGTAAAYHAFCPEDAAGLEARVRANVAEFETREAGFDLTVRMSDFYAAAWRDHRLHYVKSHPTASVYVELAARLATALGFSSFDASATAGSVGNDQFSLPISATVARLAQLRFQDDEGHGQFQNQPMAFTGIIDRLFDFYRVKGAAAVRAAHAANPMFLKSLSALS